MMNFKLESASLSIAITISVTRMPLIIYAWAIYHFLLCIMFLSARARILGKNVVVYFIHGRRCIPLKANSIVKKCTFNP